jgi:hypothetical protein
MIELYLKQDGQEILRYRRRDDGKDPVNSRFEYSDADGDWATYYPSHELLLDNGWKKYENPVLTRFQNKDSKYVWSLETVTHDVTTKTEAEINEILEAEIGRVADAKVAEIAAPPDKIDKMLARSIQLERKERLSGLTAEETIEAGLLDAIGWDCYSIRAAEADMVVEVETTALKDKEVLPETWAADHTGWPSE